MPGSSVRGGSVGEACSLPNVFGLVIPLGPFRGHIAGKGN